MENSLYLLDPGGEEKLFHDSLPWDQGSEWEMASLSFFTSLLSSCIPGDHRIPAKTKIRCASSLGPCGLCGYVQSHLCTPTNKVKQYLPKYQLAFSLINIILLKFPFNGFLWGIWNRQINEGFYFVFYTIKDMVCVCAHIYVK